MDELSLVQSQIRDGCRLALPDGLKELMSDISREVLRAQPNDLYQFITEYLSAMLITRETLTIASRVCQDICDCSCQPELEGELRKLGISDEDLETAKAVVMGYFDKGKVNEGNLLMKLYNKTNIDENLVLSIRDAVRAAFITHKLRNAQMEVSAKTTESGLNAAKYTFMSYKKLEYDGDLKNLAATKIQACYRGYRTRLNLSKLSSEKNSRKILTKLKQSTEKDPKKTSITRPYYSRLSSTSLAGSFIHLPKYMPYSAHNLTTYTDFEEHEMFYRPKGRQSDQAKKIVFHDKTLLNEIKSCSEADDDAEEYVEEDIKDAISDVTSVGENINEENENTSVDNDIVDEELDNSLELDNSTNIVRLSDSFEHIEEFKHIDEFKLDEISIDDEIDDNFAQLSRTKFEEKDNVSHCSEDALVIHDLETGHDVSNIDVLANDKFDEDFSKVSKPNILFITEETRNSSEQLSNVHNVSKSDNELETSNEIELEEEEKEFDGENFSEHFLPDSEMKRFLHASQEHTSLIRHLSSFNRIHSDSSSQH